MDCWNVGIGPGCKYVFELCIAGPGMEVILNDTAVYPGDAAHARGSLKIYELSGKSFHVYRRSLVLVHSCSMAILTERGMLPFKPTDCGQPKPATMCLVTPAAAVDIQ